MTDHSDELAQPVSHVPSKNRLAVLRDEHEVVVQQVDRVRAFALVLHAQPYRKPPEGFA